MDRAILRPSGQDEDVFHFLLAGPDVDNEKVITSREELYKAFYSISRRTDILFGDLVCMSKDRSERPWSIFTRADDHLPIRPNICMVNTLRVGRVFIAGGRFPQSGSIHG